MRNQDIYSNYMYFQLLRVAGPVDITKYLKIQKSATLERTHNFTKDFNTEKFSKY